MVGKDVAELYDAIAEEEGHIQSMDRSLLDELKQRPAVPLAAGATALILARGMMKANSARAIETARATSYRVMLQATTLCLLIGGAAYSDWTSKHEKR